MCVVAIGTNDGETVSRGHFGMSGWYVLYEIRDGAVERQWKVTNPYADPERHRHAETSDIMGVLDGVDVCIGRQMGRKSPPIIRRYGRIPLRTRAESIRECIEGFLGGKKALFEEFSVEQGQWRPVTGERLCEFAGGRSDSAESEEGAA